MKMDNKIPELIHFKETPLDSANLLGKIEKEIASVSVTPEDLSYTIGPEKHLTYQGEFLAQPNGPISHLNEHEWKMARTESFKNWFQESKVTDENGEPLKVYNRSKEPRNDAFTLGTRNLKSDGWEGKEGTNKFGFFFSDKPYWKNYGQYIKECFLKISKPLDLSDLGTVSTYNDFKEAMLKNDFGLDELKEIDSLFTEFKLQRNESVYGNPNGDGSDPYKESTQATFNYFDLKGGGLLREMIIKKGFDGVKFCDHTDNEHTYISFYPEQILVTEEYVNE